MQSLTPNIMVDDVNKTVNYYKEKFEFKLEMCVPEKGKYDWAMMKNGDAVIMFQSTESLSGELIFFKGKKIGGTLNFYIKTKSVKELHDSLKDEVTIVKGLEKTFYGALEFSMLDLNGYVLTFAEDV